MGRMVEQDHCYRCYELLYGSRRVPVNKVLTVVLGLLGVPAIAIGLSDEQCERLRQVLLV